MKNGLTLLLLALFLMTSWAQQNLAPEENQKNTEAWQLLEAQIDGAIGPATVHYLENAFEKLEQSQAKALVIKINTPGGLLTSTREIVQMIEKSTKPVITVVGPGGSRAASAGAFILLAGHWAMMTEGTNAGAASPIDSSGKDIGPTLKKKVFQDTQAMIRSIAESRGRNIEVAESFVTKAISLTAKEALEAKVIDQQLTGNQDLAKALARTVFLFRNKEFNLQGHPLEFKSVEKRPIDYVLKYIGDPQIAYMLTSLGSLGLYIELTGGGLIFPGVFGLISLILGLTALSTLPVNIGFLALLLVGIGLLIAEIFVSGFGVLGLGGLISFFLGSMYLFNEPIGGDYMAVVYTVTISLGLLFTFLTFILVREPRAERAYMGKTGTCVADFIHGAGYIQIQGHNLKATVKDPAFQLKEGQVVCVTDVQNDILIVETI